eukprot:1152962-Pelagomonas_calceolata.AAC.11
MQLEDSCIGNHIGERAVRGGMDGDTTSIAFGGRDGGAGNNAGDGQGTGGGSWSVVSYSPISIEESKMFCKRSGMVRLLNEKRVTFCERIKPQCCGCCCAPSCRRFGRLCLRAADTFLGWHELAGMQGASRQSDQDAKVERRLADRVRG